MAAFGHGEAAEGLEVHQLPHHLLVALGSQVADGAAEQAPLHSGLHHERQVGMPQHLDGGQAAAGFSRAALVGAKGVVRHAGFEHTLQVLGGAGTRLLEVQVGAWQDVWVCQQAAGFLACFWEVAVEDGL